MTQQTDTKPKSRTLTVAVTGLALFAMYFGAGNLIFPVMIGVNAGSNLPLAAVGFIITGVVLPVLGMVAVASSSHETNNLAERIGKIPGLIFTVAIFLSTGMLYAIPRVATVAYEMAVKPLLESEVGKDSSLLGIGLPVFTVIFFGLVYALTINPNALLERIGIWLSPVLILLLLILIGTTLFHLTGSAGAPTGDYATNPLETGLIQGYFTMDAIASLVFGIVIIDSLKRSGFTSRKALFGGTAGAGIIAGAALAIIYIGLSIVGIWIAPEGPTNGAQALALASSSLFGRAGQLIFGLIAMFACLTTAVGLVGASSKYFESLFPKVSHRTMVTIHILVSIALANLGLELILHIVSPINQLIYPVVVALIAVALLNIAFPQKLYWSYRLSAWIAAFVGLFEALHSTELAMFAGLRPILDTLPLGAVHLPWVVPALLGLAIGLVLDARAGRLKKLSTAHLS
ncbi:branched-chain amino acid transport system II carrier protein [Arcanobacterium haemolyticum]|nr:branched-chain amino acid transport system II carrier protein [Arcanobacterium haemolyticum]